MTKYRKLQKTFYPNPTGRSFLEFREMRGWKLEVGCEMGNWKLEIGSWKCEVGNWKLKLEVGNWKLEMLIGKYEGGCVT